MTSFNTFGRTSKSFGSMSVNVWRIVRERLLVGASVSNLNSFSAGTVIPAGSMLIVDEVAHTCEVVTDLTATAKLAQVNALLENDIYVEEGVSYATATCVRRGTIYADRTQVAIPASVEARLGDLIYFYHEAAADSSGSSSSSTSSSSSSGE